MIRQRYFKTLKEATEDLKTLPACDLSSEDTDEYEARYILTKLMINLQKCEYISLAHTSLIDRKEYVETVIDLIGVRKYNDFASKFLHKKGSSIYDALQEHSLFFPIEAIHQLLASAQDETYAFNLAKSKIAEGGWRHSWAAIWLANNGVDLSKQCEAPSEK